MIAEKKILFQFPITYLAKRVSNPQVPLKGGLPIHHLCDFWPGKKSIPESESRPGRNGCCKVR
jgi:hypothetical protein